MASPRRRRIRTRLRAERLSGAAVGTVQAPVAEEAPAEEETPSIIPKGLRIGKKSSKKKASKKTSAS